MVDSPLGRGARVLIAEPAELVRRGIRDVLARDRRFTVVGEVSQPAHVPAASARLAPDVVLFAVDRTQDARAPGPSCTEALQATCRLRPDMRVIVLVDDDVVENVLDPVRAGACGVLLRGAPAHVLLDTLAHVLSGGAALDPRLTRSLFRHLAADSPALAEQGPVAFAPSVLTGLSPREREVLRSLARGNRNKEIAAELGVSVGTVKTHLRHIFRKLMVADRTAAVLTALQLRPPRAA